MEDLTKRSFELFLEYAKDASNWNGTPLVGGNVFHSKIENGNLTDLKKKNLITTFEDEGDIWINFTDVGKNLAKENGIIINSMF